MALVCVESVRFGLVGNVFCDITDVNQHWAQLVLG